MTQPRKAGLDPIQFMKLTASNGWFGVRQEYRLREHRLRLQWAIGEQVEDHPAEARPGDWGSSPRFTRFSRRTESHIASDRPAVAPHME